MKGSRFSEDQIIGLLREHEAGAKTEEVRRRHGISNRESCRGCEQHEALHVIVRPRSRRHPRGQTSARFKVSPCRATQ
jgi:hypothetical protein